MTSYVNQYGTEYAVRKQEKGPVLMCRQLDSSKWVLSSTLANLVGDAKTDKELQAVLDKAAADKGWDPIRGFPDWELPMVQEILTWPWMPKTAEEFTAKHFKELDEVRHHMGGSIATGLYDTGPQGIKFSKLLEDGHVDADHTWADFVRRCIAQGLAPDPNADPISAGPDSPAGAGAATQSLSAAGPASLAAEAAEPPAFDYSELDVPTRDTLHWAEKEIGEARRDYIARLAQAVAIAHDALCSGVVQNLDNSKHGNRGEEAFTNWCNSVGIKRSTAYNLLQVQALLSGSTPEEQATLEAASPSLLYAAAKPSAPAELVQAVKDGDITSHKEYQDLLKKYKKSQAEMAQMEKRMEDNSHAANAACTMLADEQKRRKAAEDECAAAKKNLDETRKERDGARDALRAAKMRADKWQAEVEAIKAKPIEAQVVDDEEVNRRAQELADKQTAELRQQLADLQAEPADAEQASRDAYDAVVLSCRTVENTWKTIQPMMSKMDDGARRLAINQISGLLEKIENEVKTCL